MVREVPAPHRAPRRQCGACLGFSLSLKINKRKKKNSAEVEELLYRGTSPHANFDKRQDRVNWMLWAQVPQPHVLEILWLA